MTDSSHRGLVKEGRFWIRRAKAGEDRFIRDTVYRGDEYRIRQNYAGWLKRAKLIIDIGAHIGCFARLAHELAPAARIVCVEACPENMRVLEANVGDFAEIVHAACTYIDGDIALLNAVTPSGGGFTGGSIITSARDARVDQHRRNHWQYRTDARPIPRVALEDLIEPDDVVDVLKLDCEGSEYSILSHATALSRTRLVVGEWHGSIVRFHALIWSRFLWPASSGGWGYSDPAPGNDAGIFHLRHKDLWRE